MNNTKWPCGCAKKPGEYSHQHTYTQPAPAMCQVEHDNWDGPMICGNEMPCRTHGGR